MIAIQIVLIFAIVVVLMRFLSSRNSLQTQAWKKIILMLFALTAIVMVLSPELVNRVANLLGVGRGADLLLYALTVAFIFVQLNNYIKEKEDKKRLVILARKIAISEALNSGEKISKLS